MDRITIPGPAGGLESELAAHPGNDHHAVLCHPHPQYGGSMHDAVVDVVAGVFQRSGIATLRFNFRGVGTSEGTHDGHEADDVVAAVGWLRERFSPSKLSVAGYSFGASMVWRALPRLGTLHRILLIAPPTALMQWGSQMPGPLVDVLVGDSDRFADATALSEVAGIRTHVIPDADHFFVDRWEALEAALMTAISD